MVQTPEILGTLTSMANIIDLLQCSEFSNMKHLVVSKVCGLKSLEDSSYILYGREIVLNLSALANESYSSFSRRRNTVLSANLGSSSTSNPHNLSVAETRYHTLIPVSHA